MEKMGKMIYSYIRNEFGDKIGIVVARRGIYPGKFLIGWALAEDIIEEPNKYYEKFIDCKFIKEDVEALKNLSREISIFPETIFTYIDAKNKLENNSLDIYKEKGLKKVLDILVKNYQSAIEEIIRTLENKKIPGDRQLKFLLNQEEEKEELKLMPRSGVFPTNYKYFPSTGSNDYIIEDRVARKKVLDLALKRSNYDSWNYYCGKEDPILVDCDLRRGWISTGESLLPDLLEERKKKQKGKYYDSDRACIIRQAVRRMERRAFKYFKR